MDLANYDLVVEKKRELDRLCDLLTKFRSADNRISFSQAGTPNSFITIYRSDKKDEFSKQGDLFIDVMISHLEEKVSEIKKFIETL